MRRIQYGVISIILLTFVLGGCQKLPFWGQSSSVVSGDGISTVPDGENSPEQMSDNICYTLSDDGTLEVQGSGEVQRKHFSFFGVSHGETGADWDTIDKIEKIVIHEGIAGIEKSCFSSFDSVKSVELPDGLKKIGAHAFNSCLSLEHINIPDTVEEIGGYAFAECISLKEFTLPQSLKQYKTSSLKWCYWLKRIVNKSSQTWKLCTKKDIQGTWYCDGKIVDKIKPGQEVQLKSAEYKITYDLNGGVTTGKLPDTYTFRDGVDLPDTVERKGYTFVSWDGNSFYEPQNYIDSETKGNKLVWAVWIDFHVENVKSGKIRAFWDLDDTYSAVEEEPFWEGLTCHVRYSENEDMSDFKYTLPSDNATEMMTKKLKKGKRYYIEYAVISDLDNYETLEDLPWRGKTSIVVK